MKKSKESYWKGEIIDKLYNTKKVDHRTETYLTLVVVTEEGVTRKIAVNRPLYDQCNIGDTLEKPKGKLNPIKVERS